MLETILRPTYQKVCLAPLLKLHSVQKAPPWAITLLSASFGILAAFFLAHPWLALFALVLSGYFDTLDGALARLQNRSSPKGAVLDIVSDRIVESAILFGLFFVDPSARALTILLMFASILLCITSFLVVGIFSQNTSSKSFHYSTGIMERAEAFIFFAAMILFPALFAPLALLFAFLVLLTTALRLKQFFFRPQSGESN